MPKWYFVENGTRPNERIVATYTPEGRIHTVASAYLNRDGYIYKLYPVSYGGHLTINEVEYCSVYEIDPRSYKGKSK